jgi:translation initiation factor IF-3
VKITIMFRGREVFHPELGHKILDRIAEQVDGAAKVEVAPRLDGRNMTMVLAPDRRARQAALSRASRSGGLEDGRAATDGAPEAGEGASRPERTDNASDREDRAKETVGHAQDAH